MNKISTIFLLITIAILGQSCEKAPVIEEPGPDFFMQYTMLQDKEVKANQTQGIDIDADGNNDLVFEVVENSDESGRSIRFNVSAFNEYSLLINDIKEKGCGITPALKQGDAIDIYGGNDYQWKKPKTALLSETINTFKQTICKGNWKNAKYKYLPIQRLHEGYKNGWVEISIDETNGKIILHRAAVSKFANRHIQVKG